MEILENKPLQLTLGNLDVFPYRDRTSSSYKPDEDLY
jgi:hypothetical protein